jgi:DNA-binding response OmpR family regulator
MSRILVIEDDANIREGVAETLRSECHEVSVAADGVDGLAKYRSWRPDLVLLDIMMPGKSGYDVCREIRATDAATPVIMLTAKGEEIDKVLGLGLGADDYVTKPFGIRELLARVAAALRRAQAVEANGGAAPAEFAFGAVNVDARRYCVHGESGDVALSDKELKLLTFFHAHPEEVLSRDALLNAVWGVSYFGSTRTLDQHIAQLRKKLGEPTPIETVHGVGYRYRPRA